MKLQLKLMVINVGKQRILRLDILLLKPKWTKLKLQLNLMASDFHM